MTRILRPLAAALTSTFSLAALAGMSLFEVDHKRAARTEQPEGHRFVMFDAVAIAARSANTRFTLSGPGLARDYPVLIEEVRITASGSRILVGRLDEDGSDTIYRVIITENQGRAYGRFITPEGTLHLETDHDGHLQLIHAQRAGLRRAAGSEQCTAPEPSSSVLNIRPESVLTARGAAATDQTPAPPLPEVAGMTAYRSGNTVIDVLIAYNNGMVQSNGGQAGLDARIDYLVATSNQAYRDSDVAITLRDVGRVKVNYEDDTSLNTVLDQLTGGLGAFSDIARLRDMYGADLVSFLRPYGYYGDDRCGLAWYSALSGSPWGFSVVSDGRVPVGGQFFYCDDYTFAHELGHNMGLAHNWGESGAGTGAYSFGNGYGFQGRFGTIMSYFYPQIGRFSNPRQICDGVACGVPEGQFQPADASRALNLVRNVVAAFRSEVVQHNQPPVASAGSDITVTAGHTVNLQGSASDPDGTIVGVQWQQLSGPSVNLIGAGTLAPSFTAPGTAGVLVFRLTVTDNQGATATAQVSVTVTAAQPPVTGGPVINRDFVNQQYIDFLNRTGESSGVQYWTTQLGNGTATRAEVIDNFFRSDEFQQKIAPIVRLYFAYFNRIPDYDGLQYWISELNPSAATAQLEGARPRVVGGVPAAQGAWPWQVSVELKSGFGFFGHMCGGSLIAPRWVLTAAHCVVDDGMVDSPSDIRVRAGSVDLQGGQTASVVRVIAHGAYDEFTINNDIALLELGSALPQTPIRPLQVSEEGRFAPDGTSATVTGWGRTSENGSYSSILMQATLPLISTQRCASNFGYLPKEITNNMICAGYGFGGRDSCQGDSGGPLVVSDGQGSWRQAGIVSWGEGCAQPNYPGVYTRVANYIGWMEAHTGLDFSHGVNPDVNPVKDLNAVSDAFANSEEFVRTYGRLGNGDFVRLVYNNVLERAPDAAGLQYWQLQLSMGMPRGELMARFSESEEYRQLSYNQIQVVMIYVGMLRRSPEQAGFDYWVSELDRGRSVLDLIGGFLTSPEYNQRF